MLCGIAPRAHASFLDDLSTKLNDLFSQIQSVQQTLPASAYDALNNSAKAVSDTVSSIKTTPPLGYTFATRLKKGDKGEVVKRLQEVLKENGYYQDEPTGVYDDTTTASVKTFQTNNTLEGTGSVGPKTNALLTATAQRPGPCRFADGKPYIQVLNPNGGEVYTAGQDISVRWITCNIPKGSTVQIETLFYPEGSNNVRTFNVINVPNIYAYKYTLPSDSDILNMGLKTGTHYEVGMTSWPQQPPVFDYSDNLFTINSSQTGTCAISLFTANPSIVNKGETSMLFWNATGCSYVLIPEVASTATNTDLTAGNATTYALSATKTYTMYANSTLPAGCTSLSGYSSTAGQSCSAGAVTKTTTVTVAGSTTGCIINSFTANPTTVNAGGTSAITGKSDCKYVQINGALSSSDQDTVVSFVTPPLTISTQYTMYAADILYTGCSSFTGFSSVDGQPCTKNAQSKTVTVTVNGYGKKIPGSTLTTQ